MDFIPPPSARFHQVAVWRSLTTRNLQHSLVSPSITALKPSMNSLKCVPYGWVLSRAGGRSTTVRTWPAPPAGLRSIWTAHCSGWTKCWLRWDLPITPFHLCLDCQAAIKPNRSRGQKISPVTHCCYVHRIVKLKKKEVSHQNYTFTNEIEYFCNLCTVLNDIEVAVVCAFQKS